MYKNPSYLTISPSLEGVPLQLVAGIIAGYVSRHINNELTNVPTLLLSGTIR